MTHQPIERDADDGSRPATEALLSSDLFRTMFWKPRFAVDDPIMVHVPFLFWLTSATAPRNVGVLGCGNGCAHFAICQAIERLEVKAQATGIGFWPDVTVPAELRAHQDMLYEGVSELRACPSFEEGVQALPKGGCDLLFVDLAALPDGTTITADDISGAVASTGTIVVHGLDEPEWQGGESHRLDQMIEARAHVRLAIGRGLVVAGPREAANGQLRVLLDDADGGRPGQDFERVLRRIGLGLKHMVQTETQAAELADLRAEMTGLRMAHDALAAQQTERDQLAARIDTLQDTLARTEARRKRERDTYIHETAALGRIAEELRQKLQGGNEHELQASEARFHEMTALERRAVDLQERLVRAEEERDALRQSLEEFWNSTSWRITGPLRFVRSALSRRRGP